MAPKKRSPPSDVPFQPPEPMLASEKRGALQRLLDRASDIRVRSSDDATFKAWKNMVERTLVRIYGQGSTQIQHFNDLVFFYDPIMWTLGSDFSHEHAQRFERDFNILIASIKAYIEELRPDESAPQPPEIVSLPLPSHAVPTLACRVFISHASKDVKIAEDLIDLLEAIGLTHEQIFCSSVPGYGIALGENFLEAIKQQLTGKDALILFVMTREFFESPISLCEMGAGWVLTREHIPIIVPPFDFNDMKGVIPLTQGLALTDPLKLNELKEKIERVFGLAPVVFSAWERKRDRVLSRINQKISTPSPGPAE